MQERTKTTKRDSASSEALDRSESPSGGTSGTVEGDEDGSRRQRDEKDIALISAVAVCMLDQMN